jgi:transcriptional regulator with XRE-family HTH domain
MPATIDHMANRGTDIETRQRIAAWARHMMEVHSIASGNELARRLGLSSPTIALVLSGDRTAGLDFLVKLHRVFHISADALLDSDPPAVQERPQRRTAHGH